MSARRYLLSGRTKYWVVSDLSDDGQGGGWGNGKRRLGEEGEIKKLTARCGRIAWGIGEAILLRRLKVWEGEEATHSEILCHFLQSQRHKGVLRKVPFNSKTGPKSRNNIAVVAAAYRRHCEGGGIEVGAAGKSRGLSGAGMAFYGRVILVRCRASLEVVSPPSWQEFPPVLLFLVVPLWLETAGAALLSQTPIRKGQFVGKVTPQMALLIERNGTGDYVFPSFQCQMWLKISVSSQDELRCSYDRIEKVRQVVITPMPKIWLGDQTVIVPYNRPGPFATHMCYIFSALELPLGILCAQRLSILSSRTVALYFRASQFQ
ncbi:hypothetical protein K438DRAFT_1787864 [Mycena galopus ATCC 62051]|nr:hypothetical protein K438DRAFT_1787864 [Mycena galopus ATCC 62051]